jgi:hypothetical protein
MLNAAKALLDSKAIPFSHYHGVSGTTEKGGATKHALAQERIKFHQKGVLAGLCNYLGDPILPNNSLTLADALRHLPFLHGAYTLTYPSEDERFLPIRAHGFMRNPKTLETWFFGEFPAKYDRTGLDRALPAGFEIDTHMPTDFKKRKDSGVVRRKKRFGWNGRALVASVVAFRRYHAALRRRIEPIFSPETRWYLPIRLGNDTPDKSSMALMFAAMHRLSELSRYNPLRLNEHLQSRNAWLLSEFLSVAPTQFVHGVASEITGREFLRPDAFRMDRSSA